MPALRAHRLDRPPILHCKPQFGLSHGYTLPE
jgi:hypothetical protein